MAGLQSLLKFPLGPIPHLDTASTESNNNETVIASQNNILILAIADCIVGGMGSWTGAVLAAFLIGFAQILTVVYWGAHYQMVVALLAIILTLILRPSGLFGRQKELEERV